MMFIRMIWFTYMRDVVVVVLQTFLLVWSTLLFSALNASGYVGVAQYFSYFWRNVSDAPIYSSLVAAGVGLLNIFVIYRDLSDLNKY